MNLPPLGTIIADIQALEPTIASVVSAINPAVGASIGVADSVLNAGAGLYAQFEALKAAKGAIDPSAWDAQVAAFNAGAADIAAAEAGTT
jgi:hypothetical protein